MRTLLAATLLITSAAAFGRGNVLYAGGGWAAIDRGNVCEALSRAERIAVKGKLQGIAGFAFAASRRPWGEFHAQLSRATRPGSSAILHVGSQPFLLVVRGDQAWSRGPAQERAMIEAVRGGGRMRVEARDAGGTRFIDSYILDGAPTAIDAAAARCSLRHAGKIQ